MTLRTLTVAPLTALAIAALAGTALAGTDSDDEAAGPVATPAPAPFVQPPAPAPIDTPPPAATPEQVPVQTPVLQDHERKTTTTTTTTTTKRAKHKPARHRTVKAARVSSGVRSAAFPRGGVQAGFGGAA